VDGRRERLVGWLGRWGFATLVGAAAIAAVCVAWTIEPPAEIPSFALRAVPVYRLEVGAAIFGGIYLSSMALVLAFNNRAFTEIGTGGVKAQDIGSATPQDEAIRDQREISATLTQMVAELREEFRRKTRGEDD